jgi:hypothetical protein
MDCRPSAVSAASVPSSAYFPGAAIPSSAYEAANTRRSRALPDLRRRRPNLCSAAASIKVIRSAGPFHSGWQPSSLKVIGEHVRPTTRHSEGDHHVVQFRFGISLVPRQDRLADIIRSWRFKVGLRPSTCSATARIARVFDRSPTTAVSAPETDASARLVAPCMTTRCVISIANYAVIKPSPGEDPVTKARDIASSLSGT